MHVTEAMERKNLFHFLLFLFLTEFLKIEPYFCVTV